MLTNRQPQARILIVDDHPMVREGLAMRISTVPDWEVCGEAATEDEALALVKETNPDLITVDISLKNGHGIELIKRVKSLDPSAKMLVISGYQESFYAERALRAGALGYVNKQESDANVTEAISVVLRGERFVSEAMKQRLLAQAIGSRESTNDPIELFTDRELEIFRMIGDGLASGAIADKLFLSTHTIDSHRENLKRKLGITNAAELNRQAVQWVLENG